MSSILFCVVIILGCSASNQFGLDDEELGAQYIPPNDPSILEKLLEQHSHRPIAPQQPAINVQEELNKLNFSYTWDSTWPTSSRKLGVVSAVCFDEPDKVVVFHRADHVWDANTFDQNNVYRPRDRGPIAENAIVAFDRNTGAVAYEWGKNLFYMPHGLTIDHSGNVWVTDVGLHQVMKFSGNNRTSPALVLGTAFQPGNSQTKFCKPTAVAVLANDDFFVADGYCNSRIIKYSKNGDVILSWGRNSFSGYAFTHAPENFFAIPHALTLATDLDLICVADRENGRVQCFSTLNGTFHSQYHSPVIGDRLFSVAYAPINGGQLYVVNGPQIANHPATKNQVLGFVIEMKTGAIVSKFGPNQQPFENPHDIIVTPDGREIYVAQLTPKIAFKFVRTDTIDAGKSVTTNTTTDIAKTASKSKINSANDIPVVGRAQTFKSAASLSTYAEGSRSVLIIVAVFVALTCVILFAAWIISRYRRSAKANNSQHNDVEYNKLLSQC